MERTFSVMVYAPVLGLLGGCLLVLGWLGGTLTSGLKLDSCWIPSSFLCRPYIPYVLFLIRLWDLITNLPILTLLLASVFTELF